MPDEDGLSGEEIVLLIEALDALIPYAEENRGVISDDERRRWTSHWQLRRRLKEAIHMSSTTRLPVGSMRSYGVSE